MMRRETINYMYCSIVKHKLSLQDILCKLLEWANMRDERAIKSNVITSETMLNDIKKYAIGDSNEP